MARWLVGQVGRGHRVELQASTADTEQARDARGSYTSMGMHPMTGRERSRVVTAADDGFKLWVTDEYVVTSGWEPTEHRDTVVHAAWSALDGLIRDALVETTMRAHGYDMGTAERHFAGTGPDDETTVLVIRHTLHSDTDMTTSPPLPPSPPLPHMAGRRAVDEGGGFNERLSALRN